MSSGPHPDGKRNPHDAVANPSGNDSLLDPIEQGRVNRRGSFKISPRATAGSTVPSKVALALAR